MQVYFPESLGTIDQSVLSTKWTCLDIYPSFAWAFPFRPLAMCIWEVVIQSLDTSIWSSVMLAKYDVWVDSTSTML